MRPPGRVTILGITQKNMVMPMNTAPGAPYLPFDEGLKEFRISRTRGFELLRAGLLNSFTIGRRRYVMVDSLRTLPERADGWTREKQRAIDAKARGGAP